MSVEVFEKMKIQERDWRILLDLFMCRVMSLRHVCDLHFAGRMEGAKKRLQKLKRAGLVRERPRRVGTPSLLHLTKQAFLELQKDGRLDQFPAMSPGLMEKRGNVSELTLQHELEIMNVRTALQLALEAHPALTLAEFSTWPALYEFTALHVSSALGRRQLTIRPDGFIRVHERDGGEVFEHMFFLEVDRSTETQEIIGQKGSCYLNFYQSGGMAERFGSTKDKFRDFPFRTLVVFRSEERRNNAAESMLRNDPPILTQVWLTTKAEVAADPLGAIWMRPKDVLEATRGTSFDLQFRSTEPTYRRRPQRESLIRARTKLQALFERAIGLQ
jgi:hypothetical protein